MRRWVTWMGADEQLVLCSFVQQEKGRKERIEKIV